MNALSVRIIAEPMSSFVDVIDPRHCCLVMHDWSAYSSFAFVVWWRSLPCRDNVKAAMYIWRYHRNVMYMYVCLHVCMYGHGVHVQMYAATWILHRKSSLPWSDSCNTRFKVDIVTHLIMRTGIAPCSHFCLHVCVVCGDVARRTWSPSTDQNVCQTYTFVADILLLYGAMGRHTSSYARRMCDHTRSVCMHLLYRDC